MNFKINESGVIENPEYITIYQNKRCEIVIKLGAHKNKWSFGFSVEDTRGMGPSCGVNFKYKKGHGFFNDRHSALVAAHKYVKKEVQKILDYGSRFDDEAIFKLNTFLTQLTLF